MQAFAFTNACTCSRILVFFSIVYLLHRRSQSLLIHRDMKKRDDTHTDQGLANLRRASSLENLEVKESFLAWQGQEQSRDRYIDGILLKDIFALCVTAPSSG